MTETVITYRPTVSRARNSGAVDGFLGAVVKGKPEVSYNTSRTDKSGRKLPDGIELRFGDARPTEQVRAKLKEHGFQFSEKQVIWYAKDNAKARELIDSLEVEEWDIDNTVYEKHSFWAVVRSVKEYNDLRGWVEFMVAGSPPTFYNSKNKLEAAQSAYSLVASKRLKFKKFYSKAVGEAEDGEEGGGGDDRDDQDDGEDGFGHGKGHQEDETRGDDDPNEDEDDDGEDSQEDDGDRGEPSDSNAEIALRLQRAAAAMQKQIGFKMNPPISRQPYTPRRQRIIDGMRQEGMQMARTQSVLVALANVWLERRIDKFPFLKSVRSRSDVDLLRGYYRYKESEIPPSVVQASIDRNQQKFHRLTVFTRYNWSDAYREIENLLSYESPAPDPELVREREIADMVAKVRGLDIPGFFPTTDLLTDKIIGLGEIVATDRVLDPSAGIGSILDRVANLRGGNKTRLEAIEINGTLRAILEKKGYLLIGRDIMEQNHETNAAFMPDKVLMNPPFEDGKDVEHVTKALGLLKPGGRLVAVMGNGAFYREYKKDKAFRELLSNEDAWVSNPIKNAFKKAFNSTGVTVRIVVINEDGSKPKLGGREIGAVYDGFYWRQGTPDQQKSPSEPPNDNDMEMLELEAQAELELMLMEEEERQAIHGLLNGTRTDREKLKAIQRMAWAISDKTDVLKFN